MTAIGETLRRERERRNLNLESISRELKISARFLEAIEQERFEKLPGGVFARSFVRQYARLLGLDEEELAGEVQRLLEPEPDPMLVAASQREMAPDLPLPRVDRWEAVGAKRPSRSSSLPALALVVVVMLACSGLYAWWQRERRSAPAREDSASSGQVAHAAPPADSGSVPPPVVPPPPAEPSTDNAATAAPETGAAGVQPSAGSDRVAAAPAADLPADASRALPPPAAEAAAAKAAATPEANSNAPVRVQLTARQVVWVRIESDGKVQFAGILQPNEVRAADATDKVLVRLGNAGGADIVLNGKPIGPVGPAGQVRTVQFTPGGFKIVSAPKAEELDDPL